MKKLDELFNQILESEMDLSLNKILDNEGELDYYFITISDHNLIIKLKYNLTTEKLLEMKLEVPNEKENIIYYIDYLKIFLIIAEMKKTYHIIESNL
jgi:hypothetical protein